MPGISSGQKICRYVYQSGNIGNFFLNIEVHAAFYVAVTGTVTAMIIAGPQF
jgi:hypothetical protein